MQPGGTPTFWWVALETQSTKESKKEFPTHRKIGGTGGVWKGKRKVHLQKGRVTCAR